jgi:quinol monooxygenase YgiN
LSAIVITHFFAQPGRGGDVERLLLEILGDSLKYDGCETIIIIQDQDSPDHVAGVTRWRERRNYQDYLAWRTERGFTATFGDMLAQPLVINYYDESYSGTGVAAQAA